MGSSNSTEEISQERIMERKRDFMFVCSIIKFMHHQSLVQFENPFINDLMKCAYPGTFWLVFCNCLAWAQENYQSVLDGNKMQLHFCKYLINHVDMQKQKAELGAVEIKQMKYLILDFFGFLFFNPGGLETTRFWEQQGAFREVNTKYYSKIVVQKIFKVKFLEEQKKMEEPKGGWTLDKWNQVKIAIVNKCQDIINDDPELRLFAIFRKKLCGEEDVLCGSLGENVMTTFFGHPDYDDTDLDLMRCFPIPGTIHDILARPGYTKILLNDSESDLEADENKFLLASKFKLRNLEWIAMYSERFLPGARLFNSISGPALSSYYDPKLASKHTDRVDGFYCDDRVWPGMAEEWRQRDRPSGWPTQALIDRVVSYWTYVVPVAHKNSDNPDIEWRYSFSKAEVDLMLSISKPQRKCYMLTKRLCQLVFAGFKIFASYFIKTSFFWLLEEMQAVNWERLPMDDLVNRLLDKMMTFFMEHKLPNYFIRQSNIIDHLPEEHVETVRQELESLRLRGSGLKKFMLRDACLFFINITVEPSDDFSILSVPQHQVAFFLLFNSELLCSDSPKISKVLLNYWRLGQDTFCSSSSDSETESNIDSESSSSLKIHYLLDKLRGIKVSELLQMLAKLQMEEISHQLSTLKSEINDMAK